MNTFNETTHLSILKSEIILKNSDPMPEQVERSIPTQLKSSNFIFANGYNLEEQIEGSSAQPQTY